MSRRRGVYRKWGGYIGSDGKKRKENRTRRCEGINNRGESKEKGLIRSLNRSQPFLETFTVEVLLEKNEKRDRIPQTHTALRVLKENSGPLLRPLTKLPNSLGN